MNSIKKDTQIRMQKSIDAFENELSKIRTGRAHVSLLDHVSVDFYGSEVPISQAANVTISDARTLSVQVWDKSMTKKIEKAILDSDLGLTPTTAGDVLRINLPPLTEERRRDLVRIVRQEAENAKIAVRNIRRDANNAFKQMQNDKTASEDEVHKAEGDIQKLTDDHVEKIDNILAAKEKELMEI